MKEESEDKLTNLLLDVIRVRPAMYLGLARLDMLATFISGYMLAQTNDKYFGDNGFIDWFFKEKGLDLSKFSILGDTLFLDESNGDQYEALLMYFSYLAKYRDRI